VVGVRYKFPDGLIVELTYHEGCSGTPDEWAAAHERQANRGGRATVERFETETPVSRRIWPNGKVEEL